MEDTEEDTLSDGEEYGTKMSRQRAETIIRAMLMRDKDPYSPDFEIFTVPQRTALNYLIKWQGRGSMLNTNLEPRHSILKQGEEA